MEKIKIYLVSDGKLYEQEVRETKQMYIIDDGQGSQDYGSPFWLKSRIYKEGAFLTKLDAIEDQIARSERSLEMSKRRTHSINSELGQLKKLKKELTNTP